MIRPYEDDDIDDVLDVWYQAALVAYPFLDEEFFATEREEVAERWMPIADTIVEEIDGRVVGFLALIGNEVGALFVHPASHRSGIGRALMDRARASRSHLELNVIEANAIGRGFYEAYGFELVGRHVNEQTGQIELRLRLDCSPGAGCRPERPAIREHDGVESFAEWDRRTAELIADAYVAAGAGPGGSGSRDPSEGAWRTKRQHLAVPMDESGDWLDVGCANGHLLVTLPEWAAERGLTIEPYGLELLPPLADLARTLHPALADRIWTGSVMTWTPPRRFRYVTALEEVVPPDRLGQLVDRLLTEYVAQGGRLILSSYTDPSATPRSLVDDLIAAGRRPDGVIAIDRPGGHPLRTVWINVP